MNMDDNLPKIICYECWETIESFSKFKQKSKQNEDFLKTCLLNNDFTDEPRLLALIEGLKSSRDFENQSLIKQEKPDQQNNHLPNDFLPPLLPTGAVVKDSNGEIDIKNEFQLNPFFDNKIEIDSDDLPLKTRITKKHITKIRKKKLKQNENTPYIATNDSNENIEENENNVDVGLSFLQKKNSDLGYSDGFSDGDFSDGDSVDSWDPSDTNDDKKPFPCTKCTEVFINEKLLLKHMLKHEIPMKCPENNCSRSFVEMFKLVKHVRVKHKYTKSVKCQSCDATFYVQQQLDRHDNNKHRLKKRIKKEKSEKDSLCPICGMHFDHIKKHMASHQHDKKDCDYCGKNFEKREYLRMHIKRIHECKVCHICGKRYTSSNHMSKHELSPDGLEYGYVKDVPCPQCGKNFASKRNLLSHVSAVHHAKMAICPVCNLSIKKKNLNRHILAIHEQCVKAVCTVCNAKFKDGYSLKMHMRMHTDERPYPCQYCEKTFRHGGTLKKHIRIHTGERPYMCTVCNKTFNQSTPLKTHMKTHTGERPYACKLCAKTFSQSCSLTTHMKTHYK